MMLRLALASTVLMVALAAASCDPYAPDLPNVPYQCGSDEPRCPDGYHPVQITGARCECWKNDGSEVADAGIDSGPFSCADDSAREPNNNIGEATPTAITGTGSNSTIFEDMAICDIPSDGTTADVDVYRMTIATANTGIEVVVDFTEVGRTVEVDILNSSGTSIQSGSPAGIGRMRAFTTAGVTGTYYAQVKSGSTAENNYRVVMMISPP
jgi:hypothetical protein